MHFVFAHFWFVGINIFVDWHFWFSFVEFAEVARLWQFNSIFIEHILWIRTKSDAFRLCDRHVWFFTFVIFDCEMSPLNFHKLIDGFLNNWFFIRNGEQKWLNFVFGISIETLFFSCDDEWTILCKFTFTSVDIQTIFIFVSLFSKLPKFDFNWN